LRVSCHHASCAVSTYGGVVAPERVLLRFVHEIRFRFFSSRALSALSLIVCLIVGPQTVVVNSSMVSFSSRGTGVFEGDVHAVRKMMKNIQHRPGLKVGLSILYVIVFHCRSGLVP